MKPELQSMVERVMLALVVWREARGEPLEARAGVAHSILTRVTHPGWWGNDLMSVIFKKWQYSSMTDPHDAQLTTWPQPGDVRWEECLQLVCDVLEGKYPNPVLRADSYYDISIPPPRWTNDKNFIKQLGRLRFHAVQ